MAKQVTALAIVSMLLCSVPARASASFGFGVTVASWGPLSLEIGIDVPGALLLGAALLLGEISFFQGGNSHYTAEFEAPRTIVEIRREIVEINSNDIIKSEPFRIRYRNLLDEYDRIDLGEGAGFLQLHEEGRLDFVKSPFKGYMYVHYDRSLTVFDAESRPVMLVLARDQGHYAILLRRGVQGDMAARVLFGVTLD